MGLERDLGRSEAVLRLPSLISGLILIYLVYRLARSLQMSEPAVWLATGLTALAPFQIYYSNEARFYALQTAFVAAAAIGLVERRYWLLIAGSLAALYLHNMSVIFVAGLFAVFFIWPRLWTKSLFNAGAVITLGFLPGVGLAIHQASAIHQNYWIPPFSSPGRVLATLDDLTFFTPGNTFVIAAGLATAAGLVIIFSALPRAFRSTSYTPLILFTLTLAPLLAVTVLSLVWQPLMISRVMAPLAPFYYLLIAWSVTQSRRRAIAWLAVTAPALAAILAGMLWGNFGRQPVDWDYLSLYGQYRPGDGIFHASVGSYMTWRYYRPDTPQYVLAQTGDLAQALTPQTRAAMGIPQARFEDVACQRPRWWLIQFNNPTTSLSEMAYIEALTARYQARKIALLRQDVTVDAWLYLIQPKNCQRNEKLESQG